MDYKIEIRDIEPVRVAFLPYKGIVTGANKMFPCVFQSIRGKTNGAPFLYYYEMNPITKMGVMDICIPTEESPSKSGVEVKELPRIKAISVSHVGSYETLHYAYAAIEQYALEHRLQLQQPFREVYIKGPGMFFKGNPSGYITEVLFPIKEY